MLTPESSTVIAGNSTTLAWSSTDATGCTASGAWSGAKSASGNETVTPAALGTADYTLTCTGAGGSIVASAAVNAVARVDFLLTANENGNVSAYKLDGSTGAPTEVGGSPFPAGGTRRGLLCVPTIGSHTLRTAVTSDISAYRVDEVTGALTAIAGSPFVTQPGAHGIAVHPSGAFVYVATYDDGVITYAVNPTTGALSRVGAPVLPGSRSIAIHPSGNFAYATRVLMLPAFSPMRSTAPVRSRQLPAVRSLGGGGSAQ